MTIEEVRKTKQPFLTAAEIAPIVGFDPQYIRIASRDPTRGLPWPTIVSGKQGRRVKFPRKAFLDWWDSAVGA